MPVIKSANAPSLIPFSMADIERHAKGVLARARQQAEQLLADARAEAEQLKRQARAQGLVEGRKQGSAEGLAQGREAGHQQALNEHRAQLQQAVAALNASAGSIDQSRNELEAVALAEVTRLAIAVARRVAKRQGLIDPEVMTANLGDAMKLVVKAADVRVAIHPSQRTTLDAALPRLALQWPSLSHVHVIEDPSLSPGGCRVFTEHGQINADLDAQLDRLAGELLPQPQSPESRTQPA
jgi:flagellar assembly protein FliH